MTRWQMLQIDTNIVQCKCGCGKSLPEKNKWGYRRKYITGHNRLNKGPTSTSFKKGENSGENNTQWKGGRFKTPSGYILVWKPEHPYSNLNGYIYEHRLVMEYHLGRYLDSKEVVHHKNKIRDDNIIDNLELFADNGKHLHYELKIVKY